MRKISYHILVILFFALLIGCGEANYILKTETPPLQDGFFGFRWTSPMSLVDNEFPNLTGAKPTTNLNRYNTSCFTDVSFLEELTSLCQFTFDEKGLKSVKLVFNSNQVTAEDKLTALKEKLTRIYGVPNKFLGIIGQHKEPEYIVCFSWAEKRLELMLIPDYTIEINAYGYLPNRTIYNV